MKLSGFILFTVVILTSCAPSDPIAQAVKIESAKPTPQGLGVYGAINTSTTDTVSVVAVKVLSGNNSSTNVAILESRPVIISHPDMKDLLPISAQQWTAVMADTTFGRKIIFLQRNNDKGTSWIYFIHDSQP
ncbi:MAG TPA: hypothetical protein VN625_09785 [Desulfuromonadaceae bacterium]|nr:hypothetical protein [Desulfuromonadaceae bacterium]